MYLRDSDLSSPKWGLVSVLRACGLELGWSLGAERLWAKYFYRGFEYTHMHMHTHLRVYKNVKRLASPPPAE